VDLDAFWDYSYTDRYPDDKANIKFILEKTGQSKLAFIGHSEGASTMIAALTTQEAEWFKQRVSILIALAPVSRMENMKSTLLRVLGANDFAIGLVRFFGVKEWFYPNIYTRTLFNNICNYVPQICEFNLKYITDGDPTLNDRNSFRIYMGHFPGGLSVRTLDHELQIFRAKRYQYYDFGKDGNLEKYGTETPPEIEVSKIQGMPIAMLIGDQDLLGDVKDNEWLRDRLGRNVVFYKVYNLGNSSFYVAKDIETYLKDVVDLLRKYTNKSFLKSQMDN
jgi:pimeloyl-ACP methyl ester carboxylesterase